MFVEKSSLPVVAVSLPVQSDQMASALEESLAKLVKADNQISYNRSSGIIVAGAGEIHLKQALTQLRALCPFPIQASAPYICYRESIERDRSAVGVSTLGGIELFGYAEALSGYLTDDLETGALSNLSENERADYLQTAQGWNLGEVRNILSVWPTRNPTNFLIDSSNELIARPEVKQGVQEAFAKACQAGALAAEPLRGVKVVISKVRLDPTTTTRRLISNLGFVIPNLVHGLQLCSDPILMEPIYNLKLTSAVTDLPAIEAVLTRRKGNEIEVDPSGPNILTAFLPVRESFGLAEELQTLTANTIRAELSFTHWQPVPDNWVPSIRKRKGFSPETPEARSYINMNVN